MPVDQLRSAEDEFKAFEEFWEQLDSSAARSPKQVAWHAWFGAIEWALRNEKIQGLDAGSQPDLAEKVARLERVITEHGLRLTALEEP